MIVDHHRTDSTQSNNPTKRPTLCSRPTIFIAECVLVYVGAKETANFLRWCVDKFAQSPLVFLNHEARRNYAWFTESEAKLSPLCLSKG